MLPSKRDREDEPVGEPYHKWTAYELEIGTEIDQLFARRRRMPAYAKASEGGEAAQGCASPCVRLTEEALLAHTLLHKGAIAPLSTPP